MTAHHDSVTVAHPLASVTPKATDVPFLRDALEAHTETVVQPNDGYQGCIVLVPINDMHVEVAMYVDKSLVGGVRWTPPVAKVRIMDVPRGFNIGNGEVIRYWISQYTPPTGGGVPSATGHP